jgi:hypothetical protein
MLGRGAALAEVLIHHLHAIGWPAQLGGALNQLVLHISTLTVMEHLAERRLPDIDISEFGEVDRCDL